MPDPYRNAQPESLATRTFQALWQDFKQLTEQHSRGPFLRAGDDGPRVRCVLAAVTNVVAPLIIEVAKLRSEVAALRKQGVK